MKEKSILLVFLDIDGVLNRCERLLSFTLDDYCLKNFSDFIHRAERDYEVRIYLASSWRRGFAQNMNPEGSSPQMRLLVQKFDEFGLSLSGVTPVSNRPFSEVKRDDEIRYLIRHMELAEYYMITIDDDEELYSEEHADVNLYLTYYKRGFTGEDVEKALKQVKRSMKNGQKRE